MSRKGNKGKVAAIYVRVSDPRQAEKNLSIPDQERQLREYAERAGLKVFKVYVEPGATARDDRRPEFQEMISDGLQKEPPFDTILTLTTSRFFRNATKARIYKHNLRKKGIRVIATHQETTEDPMGTFVEGIFELIDQYESEMNGFHTSRAIRQKARQGYISHRAKFGFDAEEVLDERGKKNRRPVVNPLEATAIRKVFDLAASGMGSLNIAKKLNEEGIKHRNRAWSKQDVIDPTLITPNPKTNNLDTLQNRVDTISAFNNP